MPFLRIDQVPIDHRNDPEKILSERSAVVLERCHVADANILGIGPALTQRLVAAGIVTAVHIGRSQVARVSGIGRQRAAALVEWRNSLERRAKALAPAALGPADERRIRALFASRAQAISLEIAAHGRQRDIAKAEIRSRYGTKLSQLDKELASARAHFDQQLAQMRTRVQSEEQHVHAALRKASEQNTADRRVIEGELALLERALFQARLGAVGKERELRRFRAITFRKYVAQIVGLRRAG